MPQFKDFIGPGYQLRNHDYDKQNVVNWFAEINEVGSGKGAQVSQFIPRPGLRKVLTGLPDARGLYQSSTNVLFGVFGPYLYKFVTASFDPTQWTASVVGEGIDGLGRATMVDNGHSLFICADNLPYHYDFDTNIFSPLVGGAYTAATTPVYLNGRVAFLEPSSQRFFWTDLLSTNAPALNFASAESDPELATALMSYNQEIWVFGRRTIEIWYDQEQGNTIFARRGNTIINTGCEAPNSICRVAGTLGWLASDNKGGPSVVFANGYSTQRVSTFALEAEWATYSVDRLQRAEAFSLQIEGHEMFCLNIPQSNTTWVYDVTSSAQMGKPMWHEWKSDPGTGVQGKFLGANHIFHKGSHILTHHITGDIYVFDSGYYLDDGRRIMRERTTPYTSTEMKRVFFQSLTLNFATGDR